MSKKRDDSYFAAHRRKKRKTMTIIVPIIIAVVVIGVAVSIFYKPGTALAIDGVECHSDEALEVHQHAHLSVFVNGQAQQVPGGIGIVSRPYSCYFWLHTHPNDQMNLIHMESPSPMTFTLGQFMNIWNQTNSDSKSFFNTISELPVKAYVADKSNEQPKEFSGDPRNIQLKSQEQIVLVYGSPPTTIPSFDFKGQK